MACLFFLIQNSRAQVAVKIGQNFTGTTYDQNAPVIPPDSNGEIGPRHFVEFINGTFTVYNKTNGQSVKRIADIDFWTDAGLIISSGSDVSDPRIIYDPTVQRWFASQVDLHVAADPTLFANHFLFAVSSSSDPTADWHGFKFQADQASGNFADFPTLGLDSNAVYLAGDLFHGETNPLGSVLVSIPKADLLLSTPTIANRTSFGVDYDVRGQVLQPAICFDGSASGNVLAMGDIGNDSDPHSNVVSFAVLNSAGTNATLTAATSINVSPYVVPYNADVDAPLFTPTQPDGTMMISANEARLSAKVYAVNGVLYAVHSTEVNGHIAIRWYRINAANHTLIESGTIAHTNLDLFFPSIAANNSGTVVIGCNGSSLGTFVSCFAIAGETVNGITTFGSPILLKSGVTSYHGDDELVAILLDQPPISRWGDYSATSVDPSDPTRFWTIQMFPSDAVNENVWSTQITELLTAKPVLSITRSNSFAAVSWPLTPFAFNLESNTSFPATNGWTVITQNLSTNDGRIYFQTSATNAATFFRLREQ